jgi:tetratricopeptide (TPR) repeat protein
MGTCDLKHDSSELSDSQATETFVAHINFFPLPVLLLALIGWVASSQQAFSQTQFEMTPQVEQLVRSGQKDMYSCDFDLAHQKFDEVIRRFPSHPIGYMYKAEVFWWVALSDKTNKSLENSFNRYTEQAIAKGEELLRKDPKDFYSLLSLAGTYGNKVRFLISINKRYVGSLSPGKKGNSYCTQGLALRPDYVDLLIGTGAFNYFAGALPAIIKPFAWLLGARGDREKGLKELQTVAQKGEFGQIEAKTVLLGVYYNEERFDDYRALTTELIDLYPSNHVFYMWLANYYISRSQLDDGIHCFSDLIGRANKNSGVRISKDYAYYEKGRIELKRKALHEAEISFSKAIETAGKNANLLPLAHLRKGFVLDLRNRRDEAIREYRRVLALPDVEECHKLASRFLRSPYQGLP